MFENLKNIFSTKEIPKQVEVIKEEPTRANFAKIKLLSDIEDNASQLSGTKYGSRFKIHSVHRRDVPYKEIRDNARQIYKESTIAHGIIGTLVDTVIGSGVTWESSPEWDFIAKAKRWNEQKKYAFTQTIEGMLRLVFRSTELDINRRLNFETQMQRNLYRLGLVEGELFLILRYYKDSANRLSPVTVQVLNPDQIADPLDISIISAVKNSGGRIDNGIEFNSDGVAQAIYVYEDFGKPAKRIPFFGADGRRFVIHWLNVEGAYQSRGVSELDAVGYELNKLQEYDIAELEAANGQGAWLGSIESAVTATPGRNPKLGMIGEKVLNEPRDTAIYESGVRNVRVGNKNLIMSSLAPGYTMKWLQPTRPNPNYKDFVEAHEIRITNNFRVAYSVYLQRYNASYSASRMEVISHWLSVQQRLEAFACAVLEPIRQAIVREWIRQAKIVCPGYDLTNVDVLTNYAWEQGSYNGVARPSVDPNKDAAEADLRMKLFHTTGEREAKKYNKSDYRENLQKRANEIAFAKRLGITLDAPLTKTKEILTEEDSSDTPSDPPSDPPPDPEEDSNEEDDIEED